MWHILAKPTPFMLVEMGAGSGRLAADILLYIQQNYPDFADIVQYIIVETSSALRQEQQKILNNFDQVSWHSWQEIADNSLIGCCFSNELVDAFPVHQVIIKQEKFKEIYVSIVNNNLVEVIDEVSTPKIPQYFQLLNIDFPNSDYPEGYRTEVNLAALNWLDTVAKKLNKGYLLTIDYGYNAQRYYHPQRYQGTLQCYYQHRHHSNPYINIGQQDITTHVNFTALEIQGHLSGLEKVGFTQQAMFLMALGLGTRLARLSSGNLFVEQILHQRDSLHQLLDPMGLGGFGVLIQSKGLNNSEQVVILKGLSIPSSCQS